MTAPVDIAIDLLGRQGSATSAELEAAGIARAQLSRMVQAGVLHRVARGIYALSEREPSADEAVLVVARRVPNAIFCLLTALRFHQLTTQAPFEVWIGIGNKDWPPHFDWPPVRIVRFSGAALEDGVEIATMSGTPVRMTNVARTVVDCFRFRNKIGLDVAVEALRNARTRYGTSMDELWHFAKVGRVTNVMRPYLTAVA